MSMKEREQLHAEFSILNSLRHPNIVAYHQRTHNKSTQDLHLYMEYCGGGDLSKVIEKLRVNNQYAEENFVWSIFSQLVTALYRCHYGVDAPELGENFFGVGKSSKPLGLRAKNQVMILHRDLKPENGRFSSPHKYCMTLIASVFLDEDSSVKLGDFGLSKVLQSHDFASTYVGTPYYMSPEICAAERYTLHSDIWSLGCVIYELCARNPPFNARSHFQLLQKIKEGRVDALPSMYSPELQNVIKSCLKTNPMNRPDTASLLNLPMVRLKRKEREIVELGKKLKTQEELAVQKAKEAETRSANLNLELEQMRTSLASTLRMEWEVKARLEIDRQVQIETERLQKKFEIDGQELGKKLEIELQSRVEKEVEQRLHSLSITKEVMPSSSPDVQYSSVCASAETDFPSTTDLSSLSLDSPTDLRKKPTPPKKRTRTPFHRARTQFDSPMDVHMADPSPMSIACLSLSPRRTALAAASGIPNSKNIFMSAVTQNAKFQARSPSGSTANSDDEEDDLPDLPSPTRPPRGTCQDPLKFPTRPGLLRQKTAPITHLNNKASLFPPKSPCQISPNRKLLVDGTSAHGTTTTGSPVRKGPSKASKIHTTGGGDEMFKAVMQRNMRGAGAGRTLIELAQARCGHGLDVGEGEVTIWDPEKDEMPSPFLVRGGRGIGGIGGIDGIGGMGGIGGVSGVSGAGLRRL